MWEFCNYQCRSTVCLPAACYCLTATPPCSPFASRHLSARSDAFILAFHNPADATRFAVEVQLALCNADWPTQLLEHPDCAELYVRPNALDPVARLSSVVRELQGIITAEVQVRGGGELRACGMHST